MQSLYEKTKGVKVLLRFAILRLDRDSLVLLIKFAHVFKFNFHMWSSVFFSVMHEFISLG